jgi:hypothetical protein
MAYHERARALFHATQEGLPLEDRRNFSQASLTEKLHWQRQAKQELGLVEGAQ